MGMISYVKQEIEVIRERDPAIKSNMEVFLYPSFKVILSYRVAHKLYLRKHYFWARWISQRAARKTGIEIHPGATIGKGLFIDHGTGVIIGETTIIGDNVTLYQGVTLGGTGKEQGKRHPTLKENVMVSAGAKILGSFTIGENSKIGACLKRFHRTVQLSVCRDESSAWTTRKSQEVIWIRYIYRTRYLQIFANCRKRI